jgi:hypothetical protein
VPRSARAVVRVLAALALKVTVAFHPVSSDPDRLVRPARTSFRAAVRCGL